MVAVVLLSVVVITTTPELFHLADLDCDTPQEDDCLSELLKGSPPWNDAYLLEVVREKFLTPPAVSPPDASKIDDYQKPHDGDLKPQANKLTQEEKAILDFVRKKLGHSNFTVATSGDTPLLALKVGRLNQGLWIDPQPEDQPATSPVPHFWYTHACISAGVPYMNNMGQQCFTLPSLLLALEGGGKRTTVDLLLGHTLYPTKLEPVMANSHIKVKVMTARRSETIKGLIELYRHRVSKAYDVSNTTFIYFN
ncbi:hypothetical protein Pcinc_019390 [Petrolisthes cinctipes]|uniref:Uncharacterized protein n=1 Tax=Petrolisthes cinctipes TaxID=88211 RepID=A0AAE1KHT3_PETCI|nr:hypothetical protein Pcinc_019390 [Petrolisthes cinctipes]